MDIDNMPRSTTLAVDEVGVKTGIMIDNKNDPDFEWSFRVVFNDDVDSHIFTILQDYGCEIVDNTTDSVYFI